MDYLAVDIGQQFFGAGGGLLLRQTGTTGALFSVFLSNSLVVAGVILLFLIIATGYKILGAGGDPQKLGAAKKTITYAIGGFLLVFATYFILRFIQASTGVPILGN